jgi:hypothetical protein
MVKEDAFSFLKHQFPLKFLGFKINPMTENDKVYTTFPEITEPVRLS